MNLTSIIAALSALEQLAVPLVSLLNAFHPNDAGSTAKVNTALAVTNAALTSVGVAAETYHSLVPAITNIAQTSTAGQTAAVTNSAASAPVAAINTVQVAQAAQSPQGDATTATQGVAAVDAGNASQGAANASSAQSAEG